MTLALQYKGFDYVAFFNGAYEDDDSLPQLTQTGANSIEATLDYGIDVDTSQVVADPNYTDSLAALGSTIAQAKHLGLTVMVRPLGFGDFSGNANESDMLMRNTNTGVLELYDISNNRVVSAGPVGQVGLEWLVAGFGDFSGNANESDMLMRNSNTGAFEVFDIGNNTITFAAGMGQVGLEWTVAGFGPLGGAGTSDMLMRNTNTGTLELFDISNNQITAAAPTGQIGLEWTMAGIAADPPVGSATSSAQLAQAMASSAPAGSTPPSAEQFDQAATLPTAANLFASAASTSQPA